MACRVVCRSPPPSGSASSDAGAASSDTGADTRPVAAPSTNARTSEVAVAALIIARASRRTAAVPGSSDSVGRGCRSRSCWARPAAACSPPSCGMRMARASWVSAVTSSARVAGGISEPTAAARRLAVATHSMASSASKSQGANCSAVTPGNSMAGSALSSIWLCTSRTVSLSRMMRARMRRRRRSSKRPVRTASALVSTTMAIRARSARIVARSTPSGRSGST